MKTIKISDSNYKFLEEIFGAEDMAKHERAVSADLAKAKRKAYKLGYKKGQIDKEIQYNGHVRKQKIPAD